MNKLISLFKQLKIQSNNTNNDCINQVRKLIANNDYDYDMELLQIINSIKALTISDNNIIFTTIDSKKYIIPFNVCKIDQKKSCPSFTPKWGSAF